MGYSTEFTGHVTVTPALNEHEVTYLKRFSDTRRMHRRNGPYYCGTGPAGQDHEADILDYNREPDGQPGLWCQWIPSDDGTLIQWDGGEKFYRADAWMTYLIDTFLKPGAELHEGLNVLTRGWHYPDELFRFTFDHVVNGTIHAEGDDPDDRWDLVVVDSEVSVVRQPSAAERIAADPKLVEAVRLLHSAGVSVEQYARSTGQDY